METQFLANQSPLIFDLSSDFTIVFTFWIAKERVLLAIGNVVAYAIKIDKTAL